jgi:NAD(P)H-nitrite reductase large subunit
MVFRSPFHRFQAAPKKETFMLKDGQKGVILQRDKKTYGIAPHLPCGLVTPEVLEKFAAVARKYNIPTLKITSAARIALLGIEEEDVDAIWDELEFDKGHAVGLCVRSVKVCPGIAHCRLAKQDSIKMGKKIDDLYHGMTLPSKMKMAVSGCKIQCGENCIKDLSLYGTKQGWNLLVGGMGGIKPRLADLLFEDLSWDEALDMVARTVSYYKANSRRYRIGFMLDDMGIDAFKKGVLSAR